MSGLKKIATGTPARIGGTLLGGAALLDIINYSSALSDEQREEARKKAQAIKEAAEAQATADAERIAELEAKLESSGLRP